MASSEPSIMLRGQFSPNGWHVWCLACCRESKCFGGSGSHCVVG